MAKDPHYEDWGFDGVCTEGAQLMTEIESLRSLQRKQEHSTQLLCNVMADLTLSIRSKDDVLQMMTQQLRDVMSAVQTLEEKVGERMKTFALIFCNVQDRHAEITEETNLLESSLTKVSNFVVKREWCNATELEKSIHESVGGLGADCSLLFVCVMSHGSMGVQCGHDDANVSVNKIIDQISQKVDDSRPLVLLVQACRGYSQANPGGDTETISPIEQPCETYVDHCKQIDIVRPHTVLLMATCNGGYSTGVSYTKALAAEISRADGIKDIHEMHHDAVKVMRDAASADRFSQNQFPEYRDTLNGKQLVLRSNDCQI